MSIVQGLFAEYAVDVSQFDMLNPLFSVAMS
jgi:hypothetical protein